MQFTITAAAVAAGLLASTTSAHAIVLPRDCVMETCFNALVTDAENTIPSCAMALVSEGTSIVSDAECLFNIGEDVVSTAPACDGCWGEIAQYAGQKVVDKTEDVVTKVESGLNTVETAASSAWDKVKDIF